MTLTAAEKHQLALIKQHVRDQFKGDLTGHDYFHLERVANMARYLSIEESCDDNLFVIIAAAYLHESLDDKLVENIDMAKKDLIARLDSWGISSLQQREIIYIISNISFTKNIEVKSILPHSGRIVQDADRLDALGAIGIARAITYGAYHQRILFDPDVPPRATLNSSQYRSDQSTTINHFYEKLLLLKDQLNTKTARQIAAERHQYMTEFLDQFHKEWNGPIAQTPS